MEIKKVRKSDLEKLFSKMLKERFFEDSDYEVDVNTIYAEIKLNKSYLSKNCIEYFKKDIEDFTLSNVKVLTFTLDYDSTSKLDYIDYIVLTINYEVVE